MKKQESHNDLRKIAPTLFSLKKENNYKVPDGYFDQLPTIIQDKIIENSLLTESIWKRIYKAIFMPQFALGSLSIATLVLVGWFVFKEDFKPQQLSSQDIAEVIYHQEIDNISEDILIEELSEENISTRKNQNITKEHEAIIEYLLDNKIEEAEIVDQLNYI